MNLNTKLTFLFTTTLAINSFAQSNEGRPNVILVFPDQMRNSAIGIWNEPEYKENINFIGDPVITPNIDKFASQSAVLTSAYSNFPLSSPFRGMLLTGMFPQNSGVSINCNSNRPVSNLNANAVCISDVFRNEGYDCAYIGKLHVDYPTPNDPENPGNYVEKSTPVWDAYTPLERRHGFNYWYSYGTFDVHKEPHYWDNSGKKHQINKWSPIHEAKKAVSYIRNEGNVRDEKKPFFMVVSFNPPHSPYRSTNDCLQEDYDKYKDIPLNKLLVRANADITMDKASCVRYYFASITGVDRAFGNILNELKKQGLDKNTIVIFTSDHGETMCSHGIEDPKNSPYTESTNIPFIIRYPKKISPKVNSQLMLSAPDIMPTILGICGLENKIPSSVEGRNYAGVFTGKKCSAPYRDGALYIRNTDGEKDKNGKVISYFPIARGIKTDRYTLSIKINKKTKEIDNILLFDDQKDPYQMHCLDWKENKDIVKSLCTKMAPLLKEANDPWYTNKILKVLIPYDI